MSSLSSIKTPILQVLYKFNKDIIWASISVLAFKMIL